MWFALLLSCATDECAGPRFLDVDGDGYGDPSAPAEACDGVAQGGDCDDDDPAVNPGAVETCAGAAVDEDCDGLVDDAEIGVDGVVELHADEDGDGFGAGWVMDVGCPRAGAVLDASDCDDDNPWVHPGAVEACDGADTDCDAATGEDGLATFWATGQAPEDWTARLTGSADAPVLVVLDTEGSLQVCAGTWHSRLRVEASVDVVGPAGATRTTLQAGGAGTVVEVTAGSSLTRLYGLTLTGGLASVDLEGNGVPAGGGATCAGSGVLETEGVEFVSNRADVGGAFASSGCDVYFWRGGMRDNAADRGGGAWVRDGHVEFNEIALEDNIAASEGGAIYVDARQDYTFLAITDLVATRNRAPVAGAYAVHGSGEVQIYGIATPRSGVLANQSDTGGAVVVDADGLVEFIRADLGVEGSDDDNDAHDVSTPAGDHDFDDDITGWCTVAGCTLKEELP